MQYISESPHKAEGHFFFLFQDEYRAKFDLSSDVDDANIVEKSSKKQKRNEDYSEKKKKIKKDDKNKRAAGLTTQAKKDKKVLIKYFTARNRARNVRGT